MEEKINTENQNINNTLVNNNQVVNNVTNNIQPENTNVTNNDLLKTAKIALAHLNEYPNYYNKDYGLKNFEKMLEQKLKS